MLALVILFQVWQSTSLQQKMGTEANMAVSLMEYLNLFFCTLNGYESKPFPLLKLYISHTENKEEKIGRRHVSRLSGSQHWNWLQHWEIMNSASAGKPRDVSFYRTKILLFRRNRDFQVSGTCREIGTGYNCSS